jgi:hypothetical protein
MDDAWYESSTAAHIACLSSVGKAEYAMCRLKRDIKCYTNLICRLHEMRDRDLRMIEEINAQRMIAMEHQKLVNQLYRWRIVANHAARSLMKDQRLAEELPTSTYATHFKATTRGTVGTTLYSQSNQSPTFQDSAGGLEPRTPWQSSPKSIDNLIPGSASSRRGA